MSRSRLIVSILSASALTLSFAAPAYAGKAERARQAIAAAQAKIDSAETVGAGLEVPHQLAEAKAALARARENLASHHKPEAIDAAIDAQALADAALGESQKRKQQAAQDQTAIAQQQAAEANERAMAAQQSAAVSAQQATDARSAAMTATMQAQAQPAHVDTTVTTQQTTSAPLTAHSTTVRRATAHKTRARKHVVTRRTVTAPAAVTTTTTVSTHQ